MKFYHSYASHNIYDDPWENTMMVLFASINLSCGKNLLRNFTSRVFQFIITCVSWSKYHSLALLIKEWENNHINISSSYSSTSSRVPNNSYNFVTCVYGSSWSKPTKRLTYKICKNEFSFRLSWYFLWVRLYESTFFDYCDKACHQHYYWPNYDYCCHCWLGYCLMSFILFL